MNIGIKAVLYKVRFFFIPYLILIAACLIIKLTYTREEIYFAVNARNWSWADAIAPYITDIGDGLTTILLAAVLALFSYRKAFILAGSYLASSTIVAQALKYAFAAPRPKLYFHNQLLKIHFVTGTDQLSFHSFPSGHTVTAFSTAILLTYWCKNQFWGLPLLLLAVLVGYSRMYLSQHFFEDVTAGSVIGVVITVIWIWWTANRKFLKSPKWDRGLLKKK
ncbi:phosphatase PAP2 family protein [Mucilaginibacter sp. UR6-11]|uniref:phosphatase PAP2 family protein n=1 Tax=Mucilaginibacter sp. UR6-11 TaxID=1435644 RepID=UPI001E419F8A|nr:phosphatase PAP2 family protein [Mucilaginibacter sp. UR6-11]MCC8423913.1 phosphatase PAP2 family protein [Mucilaginibacter sp. UR6-11]